MNITRLEILRKYAHEEPSDPFNWYSLALEEQKMNPARAQEIYQYLLTTFPGYIPTYYQAGFFYWKLGNHDEAIRILKLGLSECERVQDQRTKREIMAAIVEIEDDMEL